MPMTELSPAARSVFESFNSQFDWVEDGVPGPQFKAIAAALRAAAGLLSKEVEAPKVDGSKYNGIWHSFDCLNAIAEELEAQ